MSERRANLLFDSISKNTGDIAIGLASAQVLKDRGILSQVVDPFHSDPPRPLIVGGGDLIRVKGDPFYDRFRPRGSNILNAAGVWSKADDLSFLSDYAFVSARSEREAEVLRKWVPEAEVLPCTTTLLRSEHFTIPGLETEERAVGIQLVPHSMRLIEDLIPILNAIPHKKVFIPFTHYNADASFMKALPFDRSNSIFLDHLNPLELHSVVGQMSQVVASSLHMSIFAYSQNVPFVSIHQDKIQNYFQDRALDEHVVENGTALKSMLERLDSEDFDFNKEISSDRERVESAFDRYLRILIDVEGSEIGSKRPRSRSTLLQDNLKRRQAADVVADRDITLGLLESRRLTALARDGVQSAELRQMEAQNIDLTSEVEKLHVEVDALQTELAQAWNKRLNRFFRRPIQKLRDLVFARRAR